MNPKNPQAASELRERKCVICSADEPRTGTCGSKDPRALCNLAPAIAPGGDAEELALWLDAKYRRHGEDEDRRAAALIRRLAAIPAAANASREDA